MVLTEHNLLTTRTERSRKRNKKRHIVATYAITNANVKRYAGKQPVNYGIKIKRQH